MYNNGVFFSHPHCIRLFSNISINITYVYIDPKNFTLKLSPKNSTYIQVYTVSNVILCFKYSKVIMFSNKPKNKQLKVDFKGGSSLFICSSLKKMCFKTSSSLCLFILCLSVAILVLHAW